MGTEIERKFLLRSDDWRELAVQGTPYRQGYLSEAKSVSVRVRIAGGQGFLNIKSATLDVRRAEYEYPIPLQDAAELLERLCMRPLIEKTRYRVPFGAHVWEVDVFEGENAGLVVAEIELSDVHEPFRKPDWVGAEVSADARYYNVSLVTHPYKDWGSSTQRT
ncbi:MAG: CYTH domain-containing protein [Gammaproteobacteria bacterium]